MDFFNVNHMSVGMDPYRLFGANYMPAALLLGRLFPYDSATDPYLMRYLMAGRLSIAILIATLIAGIFIYVWFRGASETRVHRLSVVAGILLSYPVLFLIDRGNYLSLCFFSFVAFVIAYQQRKYGWSVVFLAICISLKIYMGIFVLLFLLDRRWIDVLRVGFATLLLNLTALSLFHGTMAENLSILSRAIFSYSKGEGQEGIAIGFQNSVVAPLRMFSMFIAEIPRVWVNGAYLVGFVSVGYVCLRAMAKKTSAEYRLLVVTLFLILFQPMSPDYNLVFLLVPLIDLIFCERKGLRTEVLLLSLIFVFKGFAVIYDSGQHYYATIQSLINPLLLLYLLIRVLRWPQDLLEPKTLPDRASGAEMNPGPASF